MDIEKKIMDLINGAAKPAGSLGIFETYLKKVMLGWGEMYEEIKPYHVIFAADNGVVEEDVVAFPAEITYLQARNMVDGRATISCFCQYNHIPYCVIDLGINNEKVAGLDCRVARGTKNFLKSEAMTEEELQAAWRAGSNIVRELARQGHNLLSFGEMGIGNTTTSSAVLHGLTGMLPEFVVGYGASPDNHELLKRKRVVVAKGVEYHKEKFKSVTDILRCVGGFDIVAICAAMLECAKLRIPFVIDGFITAVAYACAARIEGNIEKYAIPSHLSKERGMEYSLLQGNILADNVPIRANMALGEGTGAVLMVIMLKTVMFAMQNTARLADFALNTTKQKQVAM